MARPIRIEFVGALYHVTSRGDRRVAIYKDDADREAFLQVLGDVVADFNWVEHAYCMMGNYDHLLIETLDANLSRGMRQLNGVYTLYSNQRHQRARRRVANCDQAMAAAHASGEHSYQQDAEHFGVHFTTVSRAVRAAKRRQAS